MPAKLCSQSDQFNGLCRDVTKGKIVVPAHVPGQETAVIIGGQLLRTVPGKDFNDALLCIRLGENPVTKKLKGQLLRQREGEILIG